MYVNYNVLYTVDAQNISFDCLRWWHSAEVNELSMISFNVTWVLPAYISSSYVISSFVIDLQLINIREDITILIGNTAVPFPQVCNNYAYGCY